MAYLTRQQALDIINKAPANLNKEILLQELAKTNIIEGYNEPEKKPSFLKNLGIEIAKPFVQSAELLKSGGKAYGSVLKAGFQAATGRQAEAQKTLISAGKKLEAQRAKPLTVLGEEVSKVETPKQAIGTALNLASNFVGGGGAAKAGSMALKTGLKSSIKTGVKVGAKAGALYGAGEALSNDQNVLGGALKGAIGGGIAGGALPAVGSAALGTAKVLASPFSTAIEKLAPQLDKIANKIETVVTKPSKTDLAHGFKVENVFKYDLGGSLGQSLQKTQSKIDELVTKAEALRTKSKSVIDLNKIVTEAVDEIEKSSISNVGNNAKILNAFKTWVKEIENIAPTGKVNTVEAQKIKVALGKMGSWLNGQRDLDANAMESVSNILYTKFKKAIENSVDDPKELIELNKQLSELIPINNVLIKRIPIAERNSAISLTDIISAGAGTVDPKAWGIFAINRLSKSGRFANIISQGSKKLKSGATKLLPYE